MLGWIRRVRRCRRRCSAARRSSAKAWRAASRAGPSTGPVVAEACESDGTLVGYRPGIGVIHNISRDHGEAGVAAGAVRHVRAPVRPSARERAMSGGAGARAASSTRSRTAPRPPPSARLDVAASGPWRATGTLRTAGGTIALDVPHPGLHNLENAGAAAASSRSSSASRPRPSQRLIACFPGVARRFEVVGTSPRGIRVVDDYAHNGDKIRAAHHHRAGRCRAHRGRLPAARLRPRALPAPRAQIPAPLAAAPERPLLLRGDLLRRRHQPRATSPAAISPTTSRPPSAAATRRTTPRWCDGWRRKRVPATPCS